MIRRGRKRVGLLGLYNFVPGKSVEMVLTLKEKSDRGKGYGSESLSVFLDRLKKGPEIGEIIVTIDGGDRRTIDFWKKAGFTETEPGADVPCQSGLSVLKFIVGCQGRPQ
jgi:RimJ/RimL family protein N-acetyltransferase